MDGWLSAVLALVIALALCAGLLGLLAGRRRWLARSGGTFECSVRLRTTTPGEGWVLGVARYTGEELEWFRSTSYSVRPRRRFRRGKVRVVETREPAAAEAADLYAGQRVVTLEERHGDRAVQSDLAMGRESLTGLLSWLEAAPPGHVGLHNEVR
jgi:Protein of unknown function (DUF2550)